MRNRKSDTAGSGLVTSGQAVVSLAEARNTSKRTSALSTSVPFHDTETIQELLDKGRSREAESKLNRIIKTANVSKPLQARARRLLSISLEMQARYRDALEVMQVYENPLALSEIGRAEDTAARVQLSLSYNYNGDHPRAIALLNALLRERSDSGCDEELGAIYAALSRVYRTISEYNIARDHAQNALEHFRLTGDWRGLAEAYFGLALADMFEGLYETALEHFEQALKLVGEHPAPYLLGRIYSNMAGNCWYLKRPQQGISYLEKAIAYYESTEHKANAVEGYNNLGINLILVGDWARAQNVLERALALAYEIDSNSISVAMVLDSLGELLMLRGDLTEASVYLERSVSIATAGSNKWYLAQCLRTLARCNILMNDIAGALERGNEALAIGEKICDHQAVCDSLLILSHAQLNTGHLQECAELLQRVSEELDESTTDLPVAGEAQRLYGLLALAQNDHTLATHHFSRSVSIFEILGDRYRAALAMYGYGCAHIEAQPARAAEHIGRAVGVFRELGATLDLTRAEEALAAIDQGEQGPACESSTLAQLLILRLAEAVASRELLLRELGAVIQQETAARRVLLAEVDESGRAKVAVAHGCGDNEASEIAAHLVSAGSESDREEYARKQDATVIALRPTNAPLAFLYVTPRQSAVLAGGAPIDSLLRVVELGMDVCALRSRSRAGRGNKDEVTTTGASLMPGFIHSSPAMSQLVEEVHKIRSSDVTVLVTGDSGTGKELVARAIHALSSRRSKVFIPFNCTAVPKELSEGYLFGYRRGAFTGAVSDSPGVIRTAAGGTLFLDEIGDLPLDVQPKLLRFLQEGEIQPLGEQRPVKVDVRIVAATNSDLEKMVGEGRFREDLYYRLNVIRLRVPPLGERRSEIPAIVNYYINHYSSRFSRHDIQITPQTLDLLMVCDWPGNVRQLCNEIQRIVARAEDGTVITPDHLSPDLKRVSAPIQATPGGSILTIPAYSQRGVTLADALADVERRMITDALRRNGGNISRAARELGLTRRGLYLKLGRHEMSASA